MGNPPYLALADKRRCFSSLVPSVVLLSSHNAFQQYIYFLWQVMISPEAEPPVVRIMNYRYKEFPLGFKSSYVTVLEQVLLSPPYLWMWLSMSKNTFSILMSTACISVFSAHVESEWFGCWMMTANISMSCKRRKERLKKKLQVGYLLKISPKILLTEAWF